MKNNSHRVCVAPMMGWTHRHYRYFIRLITRHTLLYTEMVHSHAVLCGNAARHLQYDPSEHPLALQLGGSDPKSLAQAAKIAEEMGYDEVNLNVGCPSDRVQAGRFGACLMADPQCVADCVDAMRNAVKIPVTVKTRLGIDRQDSYEELKTFIRTVAKTGCRLFIIHARKAWLKGLNPKENRTIPPLNYNWVHDLNADFPHCDFVLNGGLKDMPTARKEAEGLAGIMIGREAYHNPYCLIDADRIDYGDKTVSLSREDVLEKYQDYMKKEVANGTPKQCLLAPLFGLYQGQPGAREWRRKLSSDKDFLFV